MTHGKFSKRLRVPGLWLLLSAYFVTDIPSISADVPESPATISEIENLLEAMGHLDMVSDRWLKQEGCIDANRFNHLVRARYRINKYYIEVENVSDFKLMFHRDPVFIAQSFMSNYLALANYDPKTMEGLDDWKVLIEELLLYHQKIIQLSDWEARFDGLLADPRTARQLHRGATFHDAGFPRSDDPCYSKGRLFELGDYQIAHDSEGWLYSFWVRRHREGNILIVREVLRWAQALLTESEYTPPKRVADIANTIEYLEEEETAPAPCVPSVAVSPAFSHTWVYPRGDGLVRFEPFFEIDWRGKTPVEFTFDPGQYHYRDLLRLREAYSNRWGGARFVFDAPLDCGTDAGNYFFVSPGGIRPLSLTHLEGVALSPSSYGGVRFGTTQHSGLVVASAGSHRLNYGGFAMWLPDGSDVTIREQTVMRRYGDPPDEDYVINGKSLLIEKKPYRLKKGIASSILFYVDRKAYLFVEWGPGASSGCANTYTLFRESGGSRSFRDIAWSSFGCDV